MRTAFWDLSGLVFCEITMSTVNLYST